MAAGLDVEAGRVGRDIDRLGRQLWEDDRVGLCIRPVNSVIDRYYIHNRQRLVINHIPSRITAGLCNIPARPV